jgi:hypothetical protein
MVRYRYRSDPEVSRASKRLPVVKRSRDELASAYRRLRVRGEGALARRLFVKLREVKLKIRRELVEAHLLAGSVPVGDGLVGREPSGEVSP